MPLKKTILIINGAERILLCDPEEKHWQKYLEGSGSQASKSDVEQPSAVLVPSSWMVK